jgi:hypothetical protein
MAHPSNGLRTADPVPTRAAEPAFLCASCGRTDLPEAGGWDPPICLECDAAINFDVEEAEAGWEQ